LIKSCLDEGAGRLVDAIGFHPFYDSDLGSEFYASYPKAVRDLKDYAAARGFKGEYMATENNWSLFPVRGTSYEHGGEMIHAKDILRAFVTDLGLGVYAFYCETWNTSFPWNLVLLRGTFASNPLSTVMPAAGYYAFRTLATVMEQAVPADFGVSFSGRQADFESYGFRKPSGEIMVSAAVAGTPKDGPSRRTKSDVTIAGVRPKQIIVVDLLNGFEQDLKWERQANGVRISGLYVPDYTIIIRVVQ